MYIYRDKFSVIIIRENLSNMLFIVHGIGHNGFFAW